MKSQDTPRRSVNRRIAGKRRFRAHAAARAVAAIALFVSMGAPAGAQRAELERRIQRMTLPNGLDVIVVQNRGVPLVTVEADVKNGSFTQSPEFAGLSHLYEHMF